MISTKPTTYFLPKTIMARQLFVLECQVDIIHAQTMIGFLVSASEQWRPTSSDFQPFERNLLPFSRILFAARRVAPVHCTTIDLPLLHTSRQCTEMISYFFVICMY